MEEHTFSSMGSGRYVCSVNVNLITSFSLSNIDSFALHIYWLEYN